MQELERGMIVQCNETYPELEGCLLIVDAIKEKDIWAYMVGYDNTVAYFTLEPSEFSVVGFAESVRDPLLEP